MDESIMDAYNKSPVASYVKIIPFMNTVTMSSYDHCGDFVFVADVVLDTDIVCVGIAHKKRRNTVIMFVPVDKHQFTDVAEWLYIFTTNNQIVKIGGTRTVCITNVWIIKKGRKLSVRTPCHWTQ